MNDKYAIGLVFVFFNEYKSESYKMTASLSLTLFLQLL